MITDWKRPHCAPRLSDGEIHVWGVNLHSSEARGLPGRGYAELNPEERERAAQMRPGMVQEEFVVGRGFLRKLLRSQLGFEPTLRMGAHGKPRLRTGGVEFNVAHSRGWVLIALSRAGAVGVDVEIIDPTVDAADVARATFGAEDAARVEEAGSAAGRVEAFFWCWTRREAVLKADGRGLTLAPESFAAGAVGKAEVRVPGGAAYTVTQFPLEDGVASALASAKDAPAVGYFGLAGLL